MERLVAERPPDDPVGLFELASAFDSTGHPEPAAERYRAALDRGLTGYRRRRAVIQLASSLRNLGKVDESLALLEAERDTGFDELEDELAAFLALALTSARARARGGRRRADRARAAPHALHALGHGVRGGLRLTRPGRRRPTSGRVGSCSGSGASGAVAAPPSSSSPVVSGAGAASTSDAVAAGASLTFRHTWLSETWRYAAKAGNRTMYRIRAIQPLAGSVPASSAGGDDASGPAPVADQRRDDDQAAGEQREQRVRRVPSEVDAAVVAEIAHLPVDAVPPHQVVDAEGDERQQRHRPRAAELDAIAAPPDQQFLGHVRLLSAWRSRDSTPRERRPPRPGRAVRGQPASAATIRGNTSRGASRPKNTSMCEKPGRTCERRRPPAAGRSARRACAAGRTAGSSGSRPRRAG